MSSSNCHLTLLIYISFLLKKEFAYIYIHIHTCIGRYHVLCCAKLLQSCLILCDPMDCSSPGFSVHEILQARIPEWVAISSSRASSWSRNRTHISCASCIGKRVLYPCTTKEVLLSKIQIRSDQSLSRVRLFDPMNCSLPGASVHGISQARIPEWVAISFSRVSSWSRDQTQVSSIGRR